MLHFITYLSLPGRERFDRLTIPGDEHLSTVTHLDAWQELYKSILGNKTKGTIKGTIRDTEKDRNKDKNKGRNIVPINAIINTIYVVDPYLPDPPEKTRRRGFGRDTDKHHRLALTALRSVSNSLSNSVSSSVIQYTDMRRYFRANRRPKFSLESLITDIGVLVPYHLHEDEYYDEYYDENGRYDPALELDESTDIPKEEDAYFGRAVCQIQGAALGKRFYKRIEHVIESLPNSLPWAVRTMYTVPGSITSPRELWLMGSSGESTLHHHIKASPIYSVSRLVNAARFVHAIPFIMLNLNYRKRDTRSHYRSYLSYQMSLMSGYNHMATLKAHAREITGMELDELGGRGQLKGELQHEWQLLSCAERYLLYSEPESETEERDELPENGNSGSLGGGHAVAGGGQAITGGAPVVTS